MRKALRAMMESTSGSWKTTQLFPWGRRAPRKRYVSVPCPGVLGWTRRWSVVSARRDPVWFWTVWTWYHLLLNRVWWPKEPDGDPELDVSYPRRHNLLSLTTTRVTGLDEVQNKRPPLNDEPGKRQATELETSPLSREFMLFSASRFLNLNIMVSKFIPHGASNTNRSSPLISEISIHRNFEQTLYYSNKLHWSCRLAWS